MIGNLDKNNLWVENNDYLPNRNIEFSHIYLGKKIEDIEFSIRTLNCLKNENIIYIHELLKYSDVELLKLKNFGQKSLNEVKFELKQNSMNREETKKYYAEKNINEIESNQNDGIFNKLTSKQELAIVQDIDEVDFSARIINLCKINDIIRVGDLLQLTEEQLLRIPNSGMKSIIEVKEYFNKYNLKLGTKIYNWENTDLIFKLKKAGSLLFKDQEDHSKEDVFIEKEIERIISECTKNERNKNIYLDFYGVNTGSRLTLERTSINYDITRERVRQVIKKINYKIKKRKPNLPLLRKVIDIINSEAYLNQKTLNQKIQNLKLSQKMNWNINSINNFSKIFDITIYKEFSHTKKIFYDATINFNLLDLFYQKIKKLIVSEGCLSLEFLKTDTKFQYLFSREDTLIEDLIIIELKSYSGFLWLDKYNDWFTYFTNRNRLNNIIFKLLAVSPKIVINDLIKGINCNYRKRITIPKHILLSYCEKVLDSTTEDGLVIFNKNQNDTSYMLSPLEKNIIKMFNDYGPVLFHRDILEFASLLNINKNSLNKMIGELIYIKRLERETYILQSDFWNLQSNNIICRISVNSQNNYEIQFCPPVKNISVMVEIFEDEIMTEFLPYPRHIRFIKSIGQYGIIYHNQVYPIISKYHENENGLRTKLELNFDEI